MEDEGWRARRSERSNENEDGDEMSLQIVPGLGRPRAAVLLLRWKCFCRKATSRHVDAPHFTRDVEQWANQRALFHQLHPKNCTSEVLSPLSVSPDVGDQNKATGEPLLLGHQNLRQQREATGLCRKVDVPNSTPNWHLTTILIPPRCKCTQMHQMHLKVTAPCHS